MTEQRCNFAQGGSATVVDTPAECAPASSPKLSVAQRRSSVIVLLEQQVPFEQIAARTHYSTRWVRQIAKHYQALGAEGLQDRRCAAGAAPLLSPSLQEDLQAALQAPPADGGGWTGPKVARWIEARLGRRVHRQRGWEYLQKLSTLANNGANVAD